MKINHVDLIEKLQGMETIDLLYLLAEAKAGRHIDILNDVPLSTVIEAEEAVNRLVRFCNCLHV